MRWPLIALGTGAYLAFLVSTFPAATAYRWFAPDTVVLSAPEGTVWQGRAPAGSAAGLAATDIHWRISPLALLIGRLGGSIDLRLPDGFADTEFSVRPGGRIELTDLQLSTSIEALGTVVPVYDTRGQISAQLATLVVEDDWPAMLNGEVRVGNLAVPPLLATEPGQLIPLGSFRADVSTGPGSEIVAMVSSLSGPIELADTRVTLDRTLNYVLDARIRLRPDAPPPLRDAIGLISSEPDGDGFRELPLSGQL